MQIQPYLSNVITTNFVNACWRLELETKPREVLQCPEMTPTRAVSLLEAPTSAYTTKTKTSTNHAKQETGV